MRFHLTPVVVLVAAVATVAASGVASAPSNVVVHEWGTFTSIAAEDGSAVSWLPQGGQSDLPCFVEANGYNVKGSLWGTVRMETPVLYFYTPRDTSLNVSVGFKNGAITEWYPRAVVSRPGPNPDSSITWSDVTVSPGLSPAFPVESGPSHYYKARNTDATPLETESQTEKFLFYRGVGGFQPPIAAVARADGGADVSTHGAPIGDVIMFENRRGTIAYAVHHVTGARATLERPSPEDAAPGLQRDLVRILMAHGLYRKEAEAMVDTWSDSWFEEGARLLYIVPRAAVDEIVPLAIQPAPLDIARVFVGRMELVMPATRRDVRQALASNDRATLRTYGRFLQPIGDRVMKEVAPMDKDLLWERLRAVASSWDMPTSRCR